MHNLPVRYGSTITDVASLSVPRLRSQWKLSIDWVKHPKNSCHLLVAVFKLNYIDTIKRGMAYIIRIICSM